MWSPAANGLNMEAEAESQPRAAPGPRTLRVEGRATCSPPVWLASPSRARCYHAIRRAEGQIQQCGCLELALSSLLTVPALPSQLVGGGRETSPALPKAKVPVRWFESAQITVILVMPWESITPCNPRLQTSRLSRAR